MLNLRAFIHSYIKKSSQDIKYIFNYFLKKETKKKLYFNKSTKKKEANKNINYPRKYFKYTYAHYAHRLNISEGNSEVEWLTPLNIYVILNCHNLYNV